MEDYLSRIVIQRMSPQVLKTAHDIFPAWLDQFGVAKQLYDPEITQYTLAVAYARAILEHLHDEGELEERVESGGQVRYRAVRKPWEVGE